jgi:Fic-DOC domain mobile mystery protein B
LAEIESYVPEGATPLDEDESEGLIPEHITTREELNEWEHANIGVAEIWAFARKRADILSPDFVRELHNKMFDETWTWAGQYRRTGKNIGVPAYEIPTQVRNACDDAAFWIENRSYPLPEIAARYHHRLVYVHPFPNGNGRHARLSADILLHNADMRRLRWGGNLERESDARQAYLQALRAADGGNFIPLLSYLGLV